MSLVKVAQSCLTFCDYYVPMVKTIWGPYFVGNSALSTISNNPRTEAGIPQELSIDSSV